MRCKSILRSAIEQSNREAKQKQFSSAVPKNSSSKESVVKSSFLIHDSFYDDYEKIQNIDRHIERKYISNTNLYKEKLCPACNFRFDKEPNTRRKCPNCKTPIYTKKNIITDQKMILTQYQLKELETERENIAFKILPAEIKYRLKNREYGLYANAKYNYLVLLINRPDLKELAPYELLVSVFEVLYLDISGPNNVKDIPPNIESPFNSKYGGVYPGKVGLLEIAVEKTDYSLDKYEKIFIDEMTRSKLQEMKLQPETAWKKIKKHIKVILE